MTKIQPQGGKFESLSLSLRETDPSSPRRDYYLNDLTLPMPSHYIQYTASIELEDKDDKQFPHTRDPSGGFVVKTEHCELPSVVKTSKASTTYQPMTEWLRTSHAHEQLWMSPKY
jgi:hypothetical protein